MGLPISIPKLHTLDSAELIFLNKCDGHAREVSTFLLSSLKPGPDPFCVALFFVIFVASSFVEKIALWKSRVFRPS